MSPHPPTSPGDNPRSAGCLASRPAAWRRFSIQFVTAVATTLLGWATLSAAQPAAKPAAPSTPKKSSVTEIKTRLDLKEPFNLARGKVRIVAFYSPTCTHCIVNAQGLQKQVLDRFDSPDLEVFVLWLKVSETDVPEAAQRGTTILTDARVHHYWDPNRALNAQLLDAITFDIQVRIYNVALLYDRDATWDNRLPRPPYWMHEFRGAPGPTWEANVFASQVAKALGGQPLDAPIPR